MICRSHGESVASRASDMLIYNRPYIILVATGDRAYVNLHPWWPICSVTVLRGTHWVPWCILKPDIYGYNISVVLFSCFKKFKCLGDVLASVSLPEFAKLRSQLLDVFIISSDFDLAQHFSCSVKTVECGQLFILACGQLRKRLSIILLDILKIYWKYLLIGLL